jgi:putative peptide zinc metalloprotease protein
MSPQFGEAAVGASEMRAQAIAVPVRAEGVELLGEMQGSGYREPPALVRRADGQILQLTPLLYEVLKAVDGTRDLGEIADVVAAASARGVSPADVSTLLDAHLIQLGLLRLADGSEPDVKKSDPLLRMRFRVAVTDPDRTRRLTRPFQALFSPILVVLVLIAFAAICWWLLITKGLASAAHEAFERPGLLLLTFVITLLSAGFHEFGHAAAAAKAGATPGRMGAGLYLVWPAFYTDVTDSYRLDRRGRLLTDLGGLYFNAIVAVVVVGVWRLTGSDALLLIVATQLLLMVRQLAPIVRFDGYHVLADATGVPDLFQRIRPTLLGLLPWRWGNAESRLLKPGARAVITAWVLLVVPLLLFALVVIILSFPRLLGSAWAGIREQMGRVGEAVAAAEYGAAAGHLLGVVAIAIPVAGVIYILVRLVRQLVQTAWRSSVGRPVKRSLSFVLVAVLIGAVAFAWWPHADRYRPIEAYEGGTLATMVTAVTPDRPGIREGERGETVALLPGQESLPGPDDPELAVVLVPRDDASDDASVAPSWVFPFNRPDAPSNEDSQALAVATEDGSVVYDVAFALVWADGDRVDTTNEAYAFANCTGCAAVAVSFQVVLIAGQASVIVPQNLSAAVNYDCVECVTFALASQLVVTLDGPLADSSKTELERLWVEIAEFGNSIRDRPLSELAKALEGYKSRILEILRADPNSGLPTTGETEPTVQPSPHPSTDPGTDPMPGDESTPAPTAPTAPEEEPTTPSRTATPTPTASPE